MNTPTRLLSETIGTDMVEADGPKSEQVPKGIPEAASITHGPIQTKQERNTPGFPRPEIAGEQKRMAISLESLRRLASDGNLTTLEAGINAAQALLDELRAPLNDSQLLQRVATLDKLKNHSKHSRTVVAVVGETGAGKTSLVNALLDEEKILVTSGWRACTAVICEISYNDSVHPEEAYRAEIEFVTKEAWEHEMETSLQDLVEGRQLSSAKSDGKSEAGIAHAKIRAVYPDITEDDLVQKTAAGLTARQNVAGVLGTTHRINCRTAGDFSSAMQKYLDSKERRINIQNKTEEDICLWPLIKVVRVFCRAEALSSGLVVVDLPGVADSNPARSAVARNYIAEATKVWVVAPIKRAADSEVAKELLGRSSRLQMKLDGTFNSVAFICTMADSIDFSESVDDFDDDGKIRAAYGMEETLQSLIHSKTHSIQSLEAQAHEHDVRYDKLQDEASIWKALRKKHAAGHTVYPPTFPRKRKRPTQPRKRRTGRRVLDEESEDDAAVDEVPLKENDISEKFNDLGRRLEAMDKEHENIQEQLLASKEELRKLNEDKSNAATEAARLCIQRRNEAVKDSIRSGFAAGMREIDEDEAQLDEMRFDPSVHIRDYDQIAQSLSVFAISAKAFQQLRHPGKYNVPVTGFENLLDTEVPQLIEYAKKLPEQGLAAGRRAWLHELGRLLGSLTIWCTAGDVNPGTKSLGSGQQSHEMDHLEDSMKKLQSDVDRILASHRTEIQKILHQEIDSKAVTAATRAAVDIGGLVERWDVKEQEGGRGIKPNTYLATCRREGSKTNAKRSFDFNEAILDPYLRNIANTWEQAFSHSIPESLKRLMATLSETLKKFQIVFADLPGLRKCRESCMHTINPQLELHCLDIQTSIEQFERLIQLRQRDITRSLTAEVKQEMRSVYKLCNREKGPGCFSRIKSHVLQHVDKKKAAIYRRVRRRVSKELKRAIESNHREMGHSVQTIIVGMQKDFETFLGSSEVLIASEEARGNIRGLLEGADRLFAGILHAGMTEFDPMKDHDGAMMNSGNIASRPASSDSGAEA